MAAEEAQQSSQQQQQIEGSSGRRVTFSDAAPAVAPAPRELPAADGDTGDWGAADGPFRAGGGGGGGGVCSGSSDDDDDGGGGLGGGSGWWARFRASVRELKREVLAIYYAVHDPRTPWASKLLAYAALAYALSPLDLIPDCIPVLGLVDDLLLLPGLLWLAIRLIPPEVMADARAHARVEPLRLHRNWVAGVMVFLSWTAAALLVAHFAFRRWADPEVLGFEWAVLAGTAGICSIAFVTWTVAALQHERRERDEWSEALNAPLNPPDDPPGLGAA